MVTKCGKTRNAKGKPFTIQGFREHEQNCPKCDPKRHKRHQRIHCNDIPDGAYFCLVHENPYVWGNLF